MDAWIGLIGALAGAGIALVGQYSVRRAEAQERAASTLLEQCATLVALSEDFRNRVWEERRLNVSGSVSNWGIGEQRLVEARLRIACPDAHLLDAVLDLRATGQELGKVWRMQDRNDEVVEAAWRAHRESLNTFIRVSGVVVRSSAGTGHWFSKSRRRRPTIWPPEQGNGVL
jgi:hypothetical protein